MKLAVQLDKPARAMAEGLGPCENSSATMNHGMGPGPISKKATKEKMATMLKYDIHLSWSYKSKAEENRLLKIALNVILVFYITSTSLLTYQQSQGNGHQDGRSSHSQQPQQVQRPTSCTFNHKQLQKKKKKSKRIITTVLQLCLQKIEDKNSPKI